MCPWDDFKQHCSNNGVCVYDVSIQETPFCKCNAYNTMAEDEVAAQNLILTLIINIEICVEKRERKV